MRANGLERAEFAVKSLLFAVPEVAEKFCDLFKGEVEVSPTQYIKKRRMEKARELLETTDLQIKEIAATVGYCESSHFVRDFEKAYGLSPRRYRAQRLLSKLQNRRSKKENRLIG